MDWEQRCKEMQQRIDELEKENRELRRRLGYAEPVRPVVMETPKNEMVWETAAGIHMRSTPEEKIHLFRSLFRGREDVFARRWYSVQKEKGGYAPVCVNEWKYGVCIKPKGQCSKCENRVLVPLDDTIIYKHLSGKDAHGQDVIGLGMGEHSFPKVFPYFFPLAVFTLHTIWYIRYIPEMNLYLMIRKTTGW